MKKALFTILLLAGFLTLSKSSNAQNAYYTNPKATYVFGLPGNSAFSLTYVSYDATLGYYFDIYFNGSHYTSGYFSQQQLVNYQVTQKSTGAPIDGGLSFLLIGGAAYHIKRRKNNKQAGADVA